MPVRLAGGWPAAAIVAAFSLVLASSAGAAERRDANSSKPAAATARQKDGQATAHTPATESLRSQGSEPGSSGGGARSGATFASASSPTVDEKLLLDLVNVERTTRGLKPLVWDGTLTQLARLHGSDMRAVGRVSHHSSTDGADFGMRLARTPYRARASAENVAYNRDVVKAHRALMDSPGHRHNILDPDLTALGTAVVSDRKDDWIYVVEDFAIPIATVTDAEAAQKMRDALARARGRWRWRLSEDTAMSQRLGGMLEHMISSGSLKNTIGGGVGEGWTLAFTSMDPTQPPASVLDHVGSAASYALAVSFRKTARYPFGTYWAILYLKGAS